MLYKYELACREAGLTEEKTKEIRQMFDTEYKRLKRRKQRQKKYGISAISVTDMSGTENECDYELEDPNNNVEEIVLHKMDLKDLQRYLQELPEEDRNFLYDYYSCGDKPLVYMSEKCSLTKNQVRYKRDRLIMLLRDKFDGKA